jgi:hypothetical protein
MAGSATTAAVFRIRFISKCFLSFVGRRCDHKDPSPIR